MTIKQVKELRKVITDLKDEVAYTSGFELAEDLRLIGFKIPNWQKDIAFEDQDPVLKMVLTSVQRPEEEV